MMRHKLVGVLLSVFFSAGFAIAQQPAQPQQPPAPKTPNVFDAPLLDFSVPESPAFTMLGVTPQDVTKPPDAVGLGVALLNATDQDGVLQSGIAIDSNPYLVFKGPKLTFPNYRGSRYQQFFSRMKLSAATTKASADAQDAHAAVGLLFVPIDSGDPRLDAGLATCIGEAINFTPAQEPVPVNPNASTSVAVPLAEQQQKALLKCHKDLEKRRNDTWNARSWMIGVAAASVTDDGKVENLQSDGIGIWTSYSRQFSFGRTNASEPPKSDVRRAQVIVHARYRTSEKVKPEGSDVSIDQDSSLFGARLRVGAPEFGGSVELSNIRNKPDGGKSETHMRVLIGAERRVFAGTWLQIAIGRDVGRKDGDDLVIRSAFRWSFSQTRKFE
ncbi:MAG TPA: hypothetical protein VEK11_04580 [Thermoanaerobaculia bacterium]|nr:hypothetical protein [Thermoanaerobaculia bacterium]